ncbi:internal scaffolding protein [Blackfly microvirus SF02]|uniref:Internal scaffolding protein n=1 Tax=Blackfly microvirus SF02 TaxID=2576452 RepID=A0A4P8PKD3_9VIRU|nr:internal scaffolding protein [Blackfly microvirus SF02]
MAKSHPLYSFYQSHGRYTLNTGDKLITKQSHKAECDINTILSQYKKTGIINHINNASANYENLPDYPDYQQSLNTIINAQTAFSELPAVVRDRYKNDPATFLAALGDPTQRSQLEEWGVYKKGTALGAVPTASQPQPSAAPVPSAPKKSE